MGSDYHIRLPIAVSAKVNVTVSPEVDGERCRITLVEPTLLHRSLHPHINLPHTQVVTGDFHLIKQVRINTIGHLLRIPAHPI
jgi:hypothetical protein